MTKPCDEAYALLDALLALALISILVLPAGTLLTRALRETASGKTALHELVSRRNEISCPSIRESAP